MRGNASYPYMCVCLLCLPIGAAAQQGQPTGRTSSSDTEMLLADTPTVVTASKKAQKVSDVPAAVTVITEEEIRKSDAITLIDLLRSVPGVGVVEINHSQVNVTIRGFNEEQANKLLVMIDGRSVYQDTSGAVYWFTLPLLMSRIKRIEIVRGPGSALYGANAFNGVINIITKTPAEMAKEPAKTSVRGVYGSFHSSYAELQTSEGDPKHFSYSFGAAYNRTDGFGEHQAGQVQDGYQVPIFTFDAQQQLKRGSLQFSAGNAESHIDDFEQAVNISDARQHTSFLNLAYTEEKVKNPISAHLYENVFDYTEPGTVVMTDHTYNLDIQQQRDLSKQHSLIYGASYRYIGGALPYANAPERHQQQYALFAQDDIRLAKQTHLFAGLRFDDNSNYGVDLTPRLSLIHHLKYQQSLRASFGTAFRAPTFLEAYNDLQLPLAPGVVSQLIGNPNIKPEKVTSYEIGYRKEFRNGFLGLDGYYNQVSQLIVIDDLSYYPSPPFPPGTPQTLSRENAGNSNAVGMELEGDFHLAKRVHLLFNYAYESMQNTSSLSMIEPQHKINVGIQADLGRHFDASLTTHFVSVANFAGQTLPDYATLDARIGYRIGKAARPWTIALIAHNLFDDKHLEYPLTTTPGELGATPIRRELFLMVQGKF